MESPVSHGTRCWHAAVWPQGCKHQYDKPYLNRACSEWITRKIMWGRTPQACITVFVGLDGEYSPVLELPGAVSRHRQRPLGDSQGGRSLHRGDLGCLIPLGLHPGNVTLMNISQQTSAARELWRTAWYGGVKGYWLYVVIDRGRSLWPWVLSVICASSAWVWPSLIEKDQPNRRSGDWE